MRLTARIAILWLIALALPIQGLAGVAMVNCGPGHQRMAGVNAGQATAAGHDHASHGHATHDHGPASGAAAQADAAAGVTADADMTGSDVQVSDGSSQFPNFKCSACAACCSGSALPSASIDVPHVHQDTAFSAVVFVSLVRFQTSGPERPPRFDLA